MHSRRLQYENLTTTSVLILYILIKNMHGLYHFVEFAFFIRWVLSRDVPKRVFGLALSHSNFRVVFFTIMIFQHTRSGNFNMKVYYIHVLYVCHSRKSSCVP